MMKRLLLHRTAIESPLELIEWNFWGRNCRWSIGDVEGDWFVSPFDEEFSIVRSREAIDNKSINEKNLAFFHASNLVRIFLQAGEMSDDIPETKKKIDISEGTMV